MVNTCDFYCIYSILEIDSAILQKLLLFAKEIFHKQSFISSVLYTETSALYLEIFYLYLCTYIAKRSFLYIITVFKSKK